MNDGFEGFVEVGRFVESAMKGDGKWAGGFNEFASVFDVDRIVGMKDAEDEAVHFAGFGDCDVAAHLGEFGAGVEKVAAAGTDHGEDGNFDGGAGVAHEVRARSDATDGKVGAEFDAVCAAALGGDGRGERFDGDFEEWGHGLTDRFAARAASKTARFRKRALQRPDDGVRCMHLAVTISLHRRMWTSLGERDS